MYIYMHVCVCVYIYIYIYKCKRKCIYVYILKAFAYFVQQIFIFQHKILVVNALNPTLCD